MGKHNCVNNSKSHCQAHDPTSGPTQTLRQCSGDSSQGSKVEIHRLFGFEGV